MKNEKVLMLMYFIGSIGAYITAAINLIGRYNTSMGVVWLCLGSAMLCFGSVELNKIKKKITNSRGETHEKAF